MNITISTSTLSKFVLFSSVNDKICATSDRMTLMNLSYIIGIFQLELWRELANQRRMEHKHVTRLIQIMIAIPVNTGRIKRAYSKLEMMDNIRNEFFLNIFSLPQRSTTEYTEEIKVAAEGKKLPPY